MSHAILEDLDSLKRTQEWGTQDARLKPSVSTLDLPRTPYHERRSSLYQSLPFVAVPGMAARTNDVVRRISYRNYLAEKEAANYRSTGDEAKLLGDFSAFEEDPILRRQLSLEMQRLGGAPQVEEAHLRGKHDGAGASGGFFSCRQFCRSGVDAADADAASRLMFSQLAPRSKEEEALYVECQIAEDELRRDIVTAPMILAALVACVSQFLCGYNTSVMNAPAKHVFPGHTTTAWSLAVSAFAIGGPAGAVLGGALANASGRRRALLFDAVVFAVGGLFMTFAPTMLWLVFGRFVVGVASGFASVLVPVYLGELAPPVLRGTFGTCTQFALVLGILASDCLAFAFLEQWRILFAVTPLLAALQLLCAPHLLESPRWLLDRDETSQSARDALRKLYGFRDPEQIEHEVSHIVGANAVHKLGGAADPDSAMNTDILSALKNVYGNEKAKPLLFSAVALHVAQQLCGINAVFYYSSMFFEGVIANPLLGTTLVAAVNVVATYVAIILMDQCGRKALFTVSAAGMLAGVVLITAALYGLLPKLVALGAVMAFVGFFEIGLGPIPWLLVSEVFDARHVDAAQSICSQVNWLCNFLVGVGFPVVNQVLGAKCFLPFGVVLALTLAFVLIILPETRGLAVEDIQDAIQHNLDALPFSSSEKLKKTTTAAATATTAKKKGPQPADLKMTTSASNGDKKKTGNGAKYSKLENLHDPAALA